MLPTTNLWMTKSAYPMKSIQTSHHKSWCLGLVWLHSIKPPWLSQVAVFAMLVAYQDTHQSKYGIFVMKKVHLCCELSMLWWYVQHASLLFQQRSLHQMPTPELHIAKSVWQRSGTSMRKDRVVPLFTLPGCRTSISHAIVNLIEYHLLNLSWILSYISQRTRIPKLTQPT